MNRRQHPYALVERIRVLWYLTFSVRSIGTLVGITHNAVVGITHRYEGFDRRPSPIRRTGRTR